MSDTHQFPNGRPKKTGAKLFDSVARVVVYERVGNDGGQLTITVEHPNHDGGVRTFWRYPEGVESSIRSHLERLAGDDIARVDVHDEAGVGISEQNVLPRGFDYRADTPDVSIVDS